MNFIKFLTALFVIGIGIGVYFFRTTMMPDVPWGGFDWFGAVICMSMAGVAFHAVMQSVYPFEL